MYHKLTKAINCTIIIIKNTFSSWSPKVTFTNFCHEVDVKFTALHTSESAVACYNNIAQKSSSHHGIFKKSLYNKFYCKDTKKISLWSTKNLVLLNTDFTRFSSFWLLSREIT